MTTTRPAGAYPPYRPNRTSGRFAATLQLPVQHPDRCDPIRERMREVNRNMTEVERALDDPDTLEETKARLRRSLEELRTKRRQLEHDLQACESTSGPP